MRPLRPSRRRDAVTTRREILAARVITPLGNADRPPSPRRRCGWRFKRRSVRKPAGSRRTRHRRQRSRRWCRFAALVGARIALTTQRRRCGRVLRALEDAGGQAHHIVCDSGYGEGGHFPPRGRAAWPAAAGDPADRRHEARWFVRDQHARSGGRGEGARPIAAPRWRWRITTARFSCLTDEAIDAPVMAARVQAPRGERTVPRGRFAALKPGAGGGGS